MKALIAALALAGLPAYANPDPVYCAVSKEVLDLLIDKMGQVPVFVGTEPNGVTVTIFVDPKTDHWTAVTIDPASGFACAPASGAGYKVELPGNPA